MVSKPLRPFPSKPADTEGISDPAMFEGGSLACLSLIRPSRPRPQANPPHIDNAQ